MTKCTVIISLLFAICLLFPAFSTTALASNPGNNHKDQLKGDKLNTYSIVFTKNAYLINNGDTVIDLNEDVHWMFVISLANLNDWAMTDIVVTDRLAAELEIDEVKYVSHGSFNYYIKGNIKLTWTIGDLVPDSEARLILEISTKMNKKWQEYTSKGTYELNSGATLKFKDPAGSQQSLTTDNIKFTVCEEWPYEIWPVLFLPEEQMRFKVFQYPGTSNNYFDLKLLSIPDGYDVVDGIYTSWCADTLASIDIGPEYYMTLHSSTDSNLPTSVQDDEHWDLINYILNHKPDNVGFESIQEAIWYFADLNRPEPTNTDTQAIVQDALAHGTGFVPLPGDVIAMIVFSSETVQLCLVEIVIQA